MDNLTVEKRSLNMAAVKSSNTKPEVFVRKLLFSLGYRFRLHPKKLPGKPDIVLPKYKSVIFVNGCFWHQHKGCKDSHYPKSKTDYWIPKLQKNVERDKFNYKNLSSLGYNRLIIWECELKIKKGLLFNASEIANKIFKFIEKYEKV